MQHYQPDLFYERALALPPQMTEAMNHHHPMALEQSTSATPLKHHSTSRVVNEAMHYYQLEIFYESTLSLPPQMTEAMNHHQPVVLEQSTSTTPLQYRSASRILNEALQLYQLEIFTKEHWHCRHR
jgi:hypothetical protein